MTISQPLLEIPSPFDTEPGHLLLLEPPWSDVQALSEAILAERYDKPFVLDDGERRYLHFSMRLMQSAMLKRAPNALALRYTQKMMLFLLFVPRPRRIVMIGLGGGSLLKFCHHRLPRCELRAIELDARVIALRDAFGIPEDGPTLAIVHGDGAACLAADGARCDVLLVDAFDHSGLASGLASHGFFDTAAARLSGKGVLVVNLAGERESHAGLIGAAMAAFDDRVIVMSVPEDGNQLLFAFNEPGFQPDWRRLRATARHLRERHDLDFPAFADKLERSDRLGLARREALRGR